MAIATLLAGLLLAGQSAAPAVNVVQGEGATASRAVTTDQIDVAAVLNTGDPAQLINRGIYYAREGNTDVAREMFTRVANNRMRYQMETADGSWEDSRNLARKALAMLDGGEFASARMAKAD